ncbi:hypothetical protein B0T25DRAFT_3011 [Lasiosphaeria hispida]|uniref:Uncharacterized protein n=1 Tax=Lasiosphaeria hispida TaxID=260671 RepID=A0AAJ0MJ08_9PEZI|nr:hypothetical protein B0T25DRAFT_3011 [Lasiosphaeria hispida]
MQLNLVAASALRWGLRAASQQLHPRAAASGLPHRWLPGQAGQARPLRGPQSERAPFCRPEQLPQKGQTAVRRENSPSYSRHSRLPSRTCAWWAISNYTRHLSLVVPIPVRGPINQILRSSSSVPVFPASHRATAGHGSFLAFRPAFRRSLANLPSD